MLLLLLVVVLTTTYVFGVCNGIFHSSNLCLFVLFFRAFGDKSGPPSLPDEEDEGQEVNGEEGEDSEEEVEKCAEKQHGSSETVTDHTSCCIEELSLAEQDEEKGEKANEKEEDNTDGQKTPQGISFCVICLVVEKCKG